MTSVEKSVLTESSPGPIGGFGQARRESLLRLAFLGATAACWAASWLAGLPLPEVDDGFFAGAAIHLARTGTLADPWITGWMQWIPAVHLDRFYVQPPFYPWVLAGWLRAGGVSAASLTAYACLVGLTGSWAAGRILRSLGSSWAAASLGAALIGIYLERRGLRPEALGLSLLLAGQMALLRPGGFAWFFGCFLTLASPGCHAFLVALAIPALALQFYSRRSAGPAAKYGLGLLAAACVLACFGLAIKGEFAAFIHDFLGHARLVTPPLGQKIRGFWAEATFRWEVVPNLLTAGSVAVLGAWSASRNVASRRPVLLALAAVAGLGVLGISLYAPFAVQFIVLALAFSALAWERTAGTSPRWAWRAPALVLFAWSAGQTGLQYWANGKAASPRDWASARRYVTAANPDLVLFDSMTLRFVFDFRPPPGSADLDWSWSPSRSARWWSPAALGKRDLWILNSGWLEQTSFAALAPRHLDLMGRRLGSTRASNGLVLVAGSALPAAPPPLLFLRSADFARR